MGSEEYEHHSLSASLISKTYCRERRCWRGWLILPIGVTAHPIASRVFTCWCYKPMCRSVNFLVQARAVTNEHFGATSQCAGLSISSFRLEQ